MEKKKNKQMPLHEKGGLNFAQELRLYLDGAMIDKTWSNHYTSTLVPPSLWTRYEEKEERRRECAGPCSKATLQKDHLRF